MRRFSTFSLLYHLFRHIRRIERSLDLIAQAQCRMANIPHPSAKPVEEADYLFERTDRRAIAARRADENKQALWGIHDEDIPAAR